MKIISCQGVIINLQKAWTLPRHFRGERRNPEILYKLHFTLDPMSVKIALLKSCFGYCSSRFLYILWHIAFLLFCTLLLATDLKRARLKRTCSTIAFPRMCTL